MTCLNTCRETTARTRFTIRSTVEKLGSSHRSTRSCSTAVDEVRWIHDHLCRFEDGLHGDLSRFAAVPWLQLQQMVIWWRRILPVLTQASARPVHPTFA